MIRGIKRKYNNKTCKCRQGHIHDSRQEAAYCDKLELLVRAKEIQSYTIQKTYRLYAGEKHITNHRVDFVVINKDGEEEVHEWKGMPTAVWKLKRKLFESNYPNIKYIVKTGKDYRL